MKKIYYEKRGRRYIPVAEADKLMQHESVKRAYEQFLLVCQLTKKENA